MTVYVDNAATTGRAATSRLWADTGAELADFATRLEVPCAGGTLRIGERHWTRAILMGAIPVRACDTLRVIRAARHRAEVA